MKDRELEKYCDQIESFFFRWKGRPGDLSPEDFRRIERWFHQGIPLEVVLEGISSAFQAQQAGRNAGIEEVNSLGFCGPFVHRAANPDEELP